jgi:hypothetical protein
MAKVFISYSSSDKKKVFKLANHLRDLGCDPWLDEWRIDPGQNIVSAIQNGIKNTEYMVVVLTKKSVSSGWVDREWKVKYWEEVESGRISVIPLIFDDCEIPTLLREKKYIDFRRDYAVALSKLTKALFSYPKPSENKFLLKREEFPLDLLRLAEKYQGCHLRVLSHTGESLSQFINPVQSWFRRIGKLTLMVRNPAQEYVDEMEWNHVNKYDIPWSKHEIMAQLQFRVCKNAVHAGLLIDRYFYNSKPHCTLYLFDNKAAFFSIYRHYAKDEPPKTVFGRDGGCPWKSWYFPFVFIEGNSIIERQYIQNMIEYFDARISDCIGFEEMSKEYKEILLKHGDQQLWQRLTM